jgi:hypothetical protein
VPKVNVSDVATPQLMPKAWYPAEVYDVEEKIAATGAFPYIKWTYRITEGEYENRKLFDNTSYAPDSAAFLRRALEACGLDVDDPNLEFEYDNLLGAPVEIRVGHDEYPKGSGIFNEKVISVRRQETEATDE